MPQRICLVLDQNIGLLRTAMDVKLALSGHDDVSLIAIDREQNSQYTGQKRSNTCYDTNTSCQLNRQTASTIYETLSASGHSQNRFGETQTPYVGVYRKINYFSSQFFHRDGALEVATSHRVNRIEAQIPVSSWKCYRRAIYQIFCWEYMRHDPGASSSVAIHINILEY